MKIQKKVYGVLQERRGDHGRIKVISFKSKGNDIDDTEEIQRMFPPEGWVFAPSLLRDGFELGDLVEFEAVPNQKDIEAEQDQMLLHKSKECKLAGFRVLPIENILINEHSINQPILKKFVGEIKNGFYIFSNGYVYGPFSKPNEEVIPKTGKEVTRWKSSEIKLYSSGNRSFLLTRPDENVGESVDCMTPPQLVDWFKSQLQLQNALGDINSLKRAIEFQEYEGLSEARRERLFKGLEQLTLNHAELKRLTESSEHFKSIYQQELRKVEAEIRGELINPIEKEQQKLESEREQLSKLISEKIQEEASLSGAIGDLKIEYERILNEKDRLISDIRIQSLVSGTTAVAASVERLLTYEEQDYLKGGESFSDLAEFDRVFDSTINNIDDTELRPFIVRTIYQFKEHRCLMGNNIDAIINIARFSNNCKVFIQQAEPDWIKFQAFYDNGLKQAWSSANKNPGIIHFLILEDMNIASIECYARPLLDIVSKIRTKLPGQNTAFPDNLWIFGIPLKVSGDQEFGLPLIKSTYQNWGYIPFLESAINFNGFASNKVLPVEVLCNHQDIVPRPSSEGYFNDL